VAAISVVKQDAQHAFLGLYICHPDYRGRGIGWMVWQAGMQRLEGHTIGLDGVLAQQDNYAKSGFTLAYRNIRYSGVPKNLALNSPNQEAFVHRTITQADIPGIRDLDKQVHGLQRLSFLDHWVQDSTTRLSLVSLRGTQVIGFGTIRACEQGHKVGPLIAENSQHAQSLLCALVSATNAEEIVLDVPEPNSSAMQLAESLGLESIFETARMYRGQPPDYQLAKLYGVTTFELG